MSYIIQNDAERTIIEANFYEVFEWYRKITTEGVNALTWANAETRSVCDFTSSGWKRGNQGSDDFYSCGSDEMIKRIDGGYHLPFDNLDDTDFAPMRKRKKFMYEDFEGDYSYELDESGFDNVYLNSTARETLPCVPIKFLTAFNCYINNALIDEYMGWILKILGDFDVSGVDYTLSMNSLGSGLWRTRKASIPVQSKYQGASIQVKREGEVLDINGFSALFSPGGYRHFIFGAKIKYANDHGFNVDAHLGSSHAESWQVLSKNGQLQITCDYRAETFPKLDMTQQFFTAIDELKKGIDTQVDSNGKRIKERM